MQVGAWPHTAQQPGSCGGDTRRRLHSVANSSTTPFALCMYIASHMFTQLV